MNSGDILINALQKIYAILKETSCGAFDTTKPKKINLSSDIEFDQARAFLLEIIRDTKLAKQTRELGTKIYLQFGLAKNSAKDLLTVCQLINEMKDLQIDLREELLKLNLTSPSNPIVAISEDP